MKEIVEKFAIDGSVEDIKPLGDGLINDTYRVVTHSADTPDYVLQRINHHIFTDVDALQRNIALVTSHLRRKYLDAGVSDDEIDRHVLRFIPLAADPEKTYYFDGSSYWRMMVFIDRAYTFNTVDAHYSEMAGEAFGNFQKMLSDLPSDALVETIPDFHNMEFRLSQLRQAIDSDAAGRLEQSRAIADFLLGYAEQMCAAEQLYRQGKLPKRVCHCDTKVNNMMFDAQGKVLCVIDLDTVMPSFIFSDYGDFLRTAANTLAEDDPDIDGVDFRMDIFQAFTRGYLRAAAEFLTPLEIEMLPYAVMLFPYMQAVRFYADYLNGDTYYKTAYPTHNLVRTQNQIRLFEKIASSQPAIKAFIVHNPTC